MRFGSEGELASWYARGLAQGWVLVPIQGPAVVDEEFRLRLEVEGGGQYGATAQVIEILDSPPMLRSRIRADADLRGFMEQYALRRREGRLSGPQGGRRQHDRFDTFLNVRFASARQLDLVATSIGRGGLFVRSADPPPLGSNVNLTVRLPNDEAFEVKGQVVRVINPELAQKTGEAPGAGVVFSDVQPAFAARIEELIEAYRARPSRVLLVDDDLLFVTMIGDLLSRTGVQVDYAWNGKNALHKLVDSLFDIDAVILDLHMPELDGFQLFERLRKLGKGLDLKLAVLSGAEDQVLRGLLDTGGLDDAISKRVSPNEAVLRIREILLRKGETAAAANLDQVLQRKR